MRGLWPILIRSVRARPLRASLTALAVALGVAAVLSTQLALGALDRQAHDAAGQHAGRSDLDVRAVAGRGLLPTEVEQLTRTPGVDAVAPLYEKRVTAASAAAALDAVEVTVVGVSGGEAALRAVILVSGRVPGEAVGVHEVALDGGVVDALAARSGHRLAVGDTVFLTTATGPDPFIVSGISAGTLGGASLSRAAAFVSMADATGALALGIHVPLAALRLAPGVDAAGVAAAIRAALGPAVATVDPRAGVIEPLSQLRPLLALVVVLSVVLGAGVCANSIAVSAAERRRDTGLLRAAGASRRQVLALFLAEAALVATAGAAAGLLAGFGLAIGLVHTAAAADLPVPALGASAGQVVAAIGAGVGAAIVGALLPALMATRVTALTALRASPGERERPSRWVRRAVPALGGGAGVLLAIGTAPAVAAGTVLALVALALLLPLAGPLLTRGLGWALAPLLPRAPMAAANLARRRNRTGLVLGVLTMSVAAAVAMASLTNGALTAGDQWVGGLFAGDTVLVSPATAQDAVAAQISSTAGVTVGRLRFMSASVDGLVTGITALDVQPYLDRGGLDVVEGDRAAALTRVAQTPAVLVPLELADRYGWRVGRTLEVDPGSGAFPVTVSIAAVVAHTFPSGDGRESLIMGREPAVRMLGSAAAGFDDLQVIDGAGRASVVQRAASAYGMQTTAVAEIQAAARASLQHPLRLLGGLSWVGVLIAMLAMVNTLVVNVRQGTRELALLRAVGLSRVRAVRLVMVEAGLLAVVGVLVGALAGCALAVPLLRASASSGFTPAFTVPLATVAAVLAAVLAGAVLAAYLPARQATRASIVSAIRYE